MSAVYMNGVYEQVVEEIRIVQEKQPELVCFMQPYSTSRITNLVKNPPSADAPIDFYISLTDSLGFVSYRASIVGWEDKTLMSAERIAAVDLIIAEHQPTEGLVSEPSSDGKIPINLILV
ncbi:MAG: hypothetical protein KDA51_00520, partial [Planctomycetales bacterium]|nr:hypothetical protein [Planctomycetales bacterium]